MNGLQAFNELEEILPELDDIGGATGRRFVLEVLFEGAFVGVFQQDVALISVAVTTVEPDDAANLFYGTEAVHLLVVLRTTLWSRISFHKESVGVRGVLRLCLRQSPGLWFIGIGDI